MRTRSSDNNDNNQIISSESNQISENNYPNMGSQIKYPPFNIENTDLFFEILDSVIKCYNIPKDQAFLNVFITLPYSIQALSKHLLTEITEDPIQNFKKLIDDKFKVPIEERLKKLLNSKKSNEMKPSAYLLYIRDTLGKEAENHKELLRSHFIDSLPKNMGPIIQLLSPDCSLDLIAAAADKQYTNEINQVLMDEKILKSVEINSINKNNEIDISKQLELLQKQISSLQEDIHKLKNNNNNKYQKYRSVSRESRPQIQNNQNRRRSQSFHKPNICYWHSTFKEKSYKCNQPCDYDKINGLQNQQYMQQKNY